MDKLPNPWLTINAKPVKVKRKPKKNKASKYCKINGTNRCEWPRSCNC